MHMLTTQTHASCECVKHMTHDWQQARGRREERRKRGSGPRHISRHAGGSSLIVAQGREPLPPPHPLSPTSVAVKVTLRACVIRCRPRSCHPSAVADVANRRHLSVIFLLSDTQLRRNERQRADRIKFKEHPTATLGSTHHVPSVWKWAGRSRVRMLWYTSQLLMDYYSSHSLSVECPVQLLSFSLSLLSFFFCFCFACEYTWRGNWWWFGGGREQKFPLESCFLLLSQRATHIKGSCVPPFIGNNT